jgi:hypothetical protein
MVAEQRKKQGPPQRPQMTAEALKHLAREQQMAMATT